MNLLDEEIEALSAIYFDTFDRDTVTKDPSSGITSYCVGVKSLSSDFENAFFTLRFELPREYPETIAARISLDSSNVELSEQEVEDLIHTLHKVAKENIGSVHVFNLVSAAQEWYECLLETRKARLTNLSIDTLLSEVETRGHMCLTKEQFLNWRTGFEKRQKELAAATPGAVFVAGVMKIRKSSANGDKMTGKQIFESGIGVVNDTEYENDAEGEDGVVVDYELFKGLDSIDINDAGDTNGRDS